MRPQTSRYPLLCITKGQIKVFFNIKLVMVSLSFLLVIAAAALQTEHIKNPDEFIYSQPCYLRLWLTGSRHCFQTVSPTLIGSIHSWFTLLCSPHLLWVQSARLHLKVRHRHSTSMFTVPISQLCGSLFVCSHSLKLSFPTDSRAACFPHLLSPPCLHLSARLSVSLSNWLPV